MVSQGEKVAEFEDAIRKYLGCKYAVATSSCTAGLYLILGFANRIYVPAFTFPAVHKVVDKLEDPEQGYPFLHNIDVEKSTYNMDSNKLIDEINNITVDDIIGMDENDWEFEVTVPIHQFGLPCWSDDLEKLRNEVGMTFIEDAACALGSTYPTGEPVGKRGTAVFSFHGRKIITTGEGGMVCTDDEEIYESVLRGRQFGKNKMGAFTSTGGINFKMSDIQAAIGIEQLKKLPEILKLRRVIADQYFTSLDPFQCWIDGYQANNYFKLPSPIMGTNWQSFVIRFREKNCVPSRNTVMGRMRNAGIEVQVGSYDNSNGSCHISAELARTTLALPIWPQMRLEDVELVVNELKRACENA